MKPKFILAAVALSCSLMIALLPQISNLPRVNAQSAAQSAANAQPLPIVTLQPTASAARIANAQINAPADTAPADTTLADFVQSLPTAPANALIGVYARGVFALPVVQQPQGDPEFVSDGAGALTQYAAPAASGVTALLAHNTLSGRYFSQLANGQSLLLIFGDKRIARYHIQRSEHFRATRPTDPFSDFVSLDDPSAALSSFAQIFAHFYQTPGQLILQTCITAQGNPSWGRLFVVATPE